MEDNVLGIYYSIDAEGVKHYRCRGMGRDYMLFYGWIGRSRSYRCTHEDFPWDYFIIRDPEEDREMNELFGYAIVMDEVARNV